MLQDMTTQWPPTTNQHAQTAAPAVPSCVPTCATAPCTRQPGEPLFDIFSGGYADRGDEEDNQKDRRAAKVRVENGGLIVASNILL